MAVVMAILLALSVFTIAGSHVAVAGLLGHFWRPQTVFQGGDAAVIRSSRVPRSTAAGFEVSLVWEWAAFDPKALEDRLPADVTVTSLTLNLPARILSVGQVSVGERLTGTALYGRSITGDYQPDIVSGRALCPQDEGHLVGVISQRHYLVAGASGSATKVPPAARIRLGDKITFVVPSVKPGKGIPFVMGAAPLWGDRYLCWDEPVTVEVTVVGIFEEPGTLRSAVFVPLGTLQQATGAVSLVNLAGIRGDTRLTDSPNPSPLGGDFYVFAPAFTFAPLALQMEALRLQGRALVATVTLLTTLVLMAIAVAELAQRRRETSLLNALGLTPRDVVILAMFRFAGVVFFGLALAIPPLVAVAYGLLGKDAPQTLLPALRLVWPVLVLVVVGAVVSAVAAPKHPLEGLTNE